MAVENVVKESVEHNASNQHDLKTDETNETKGKASLPSFQQFMDLVREESVNNQTTTSGYNVYSKYNKSC